MEECGENPQVPRTAMANECKMKKQIEDRDMLPELPTGSRSQLLNYINEVSFAAYDACFFLTHIRTMQMLWRIFANTAGCAMRH